MARVPEALQGGIMSAVIPIFNVVDGADTTHEVLSSEVGKVFGITIECSPIRMSDEQYNDRIEVTKPLISIIFPH